MSQDFCSLIDEQITDERKAKETYERLLGLFGREKDHLTHNMPHAQRSLLTLITEGRIEETLRDEERHAKWFIELKKQLCQIKE